MNLDWIPVIIHGFLVTISFHHESNSSLTDKLHSVKYMPVFQGKACMELKS